MGQVECVQTDPKIQYYMKKLLYLFSGKYIDYY